MPRTQRIFLSRLNIFVDRGRKSYERVDVQALHLSVEGSKPHLISVPTFVTRRGASYPLVEAVLGGDGTVWIGKASILAGSFVVYYRQGDSMGVNKTLLSLDKAFVWRGDAVVFRADNDGRLTMFDGRKDTRTVLAAAMKRLSELKPSKRGMGEGPLTGRYSAFMLQIILNLRRASLESTRHALVGLLARLTWKDLFGFVIVLPSH
ncbi:hypothetical protein NLJ89_g8345 [Agrocybe chaxingu]|uniref:Uncharacterized protein n=1 Tax=Agrocybe chaxingu TaxID=84603 RepID=A0A9W8MU69_9AGAR|nr:hypothetical protein NLJ89_g8345 [Agrocybe chaxingu]